MDTKDDMRKTMNNLRDTFLQRSQELDALEQNNLIDALDLLLSVNESLRLQIDQLLTQEIKQDRKRPILRLVR